MVERKIGVALCFHLQNRFDELKYIPLSPALETGAVIVWKKAQICFTHDAAVYQFY